MARKSSKTAHVLNLLAGHDNKKESGEELQNTGSGTTDAQTAASPAEATPDAEPQKPVPQTPPAVSIIDHSEEDPVAELIQDKLLDELEQAGHTSSTADLSAEETVPAPEPVPAATADTILAELQDADEPDTAGEPLTTTEDIVAELHASEELPETPETKEVVANPAPAEEPEPDFVCINVMERIVKDKIIYYMREFDCCTCDHCIADTVALTLNGLAPKYIVAPPAAEAPLISFYTNKYISDVTVEATKACIVVKEHPRH